MSHFIVLVVGDNIDGQLAAYDGNLETLPRREYLDAKDVAEMADHYEIDPANLAALAAKMDDWEGWPGGVDAEGLYRVCTYNEMRSGTGTRSADAGAAS